MPLRNEKFVRQIRKAGLAAMAVALLGGTALAEQVTLRDDISVDAPVVRVGDLFIGVGEQADAVVMAAPAPGKSEDLSIYELGRIAKDYGLEWQRPTLLRRISVQREGVPFEFSDLETLILDEAAAEGLTGEFDIQIYGNNRGLYLPADATLADAFFESFELSGMKDRFKAVLVLPTGGKEPERLALTGRIEEVRLLPMFNRVVAPGEVIAKSDISWEKFPARRINANAVLSTEELVGMTVKRAHQPGKPIMERDVATPIVIAKGSIVNMTLRSGGLIVTASGRALESGGLGETIRLMNTKSKQTVDARVVRPGLAEVVRLDAVNIAAAM